MKRFTPGAEAVVVQTIPGRSIIFEGTLTLETKNVAEAAGEISRIAIESGGTLFDSEMHVSDPQTAHASVTIKVPPANIGTAMEQIGTLGRLRDYNQDAQDITTQMVDLDARILTATASVDRVRGFLDQTRNVSELAGLEAELTVRETELEQLRAQQRALKDRVALATLTIDIVVPQVPVTTTMAPVPVTEEPLTAASSFAKSRHALWRVLVGIAIVLAAVAPFLAVFGVPLALAWYIVRRTRRRHAQRDRDQDGEAQRGGGERDGRLHALADQRGDRLVPEHRLAQVAADQRAEPDQELLPQGLVEAERLADLGDVLGRGVVAGDDGGRVAGRQVQEEEDEQRHDRHDRNHRNQASDDIGDHALAACPRLAAVATGRRAPARIPSAKCGPRRHRSGQGRTQPLVTFHHGMISAIGRRPLMFDRSAAGWTHWP